ncbi:MAG: hypothetical protein IPI82_16560 [Candidatus Microthrix sp.]|nr:hypothetical protein [Candidatus Microthrix sp.]MBK7323996.1 hypothetical protein [Candidatus Microthrix sp.]
MNVGTGEVIHETRNRHAGDDVLAFFKQIDKATPPLGDPRCWTTCRPTSPRRSKNGSRSPARNDGTCISCPDEFVGLNLVEGWFAQLAKKALKNTSHNSVAALKTTIDT